MKPALQIRLNQQLALTPQLQQAIRLLQLSSMELELELNAAIESNPLLELEGDREDVDTGEAETVDGVESAPETAAEAAESASENDDGPLDLEL
jgi:RNA polymerase sigma-54 factor